MEGAVGIVVAGFGLRGVVGGGGGEVGLGLQLGLGRGFGLGRRRRELRRRRLGGGDLLLHRGLSDGLDLRLGLRLGLGFGLGLDPSRQLGEVVEVEGLEHCGVDPGVALDLGEPLLGGAAPGLGLDVVEEPGEAVVVEVGQGGLRRPQGGAEVGHGGGVGVDPGQLGEYGVVCSAAHHRHRPAAGLDLLEPDDEVGALVRRRGRRRGHGGARRLLGGDAGGVEGEQELVDRATETLAEHPGDVDGAALAEGRRRLLVEPARRLQVAEPPVEQVGDLRGVRDHRGDHLRPGAAEHVGAARSSDGRRRAGGGLRVHRGDSPPAAGRRRRLLVDEAATHVTAACPTPPRRCRSAPPAAQRPSRATTASATCEVPTAVGSSRSAFMS